MLDLSQFRLVDLSVTLHPGREDRRLEIRRGVIPSDDTIMHEVDLMSHVGTHVEAMSHFYEDGRDITELPLERFVGRSVLLRLGDVPAGADLAAEDLERAAEGLQVEEAIVLLTSGRSTDEAPNLTADAAQWLADRDVAMMGIDDSVGLGKDAEVIRAVHDVLMSRSVPFLEVLSGLDQLRRREFLLIALPLKIAGLDSSPVRAVALEAL